MAVVSIAAIRLLSSRINQGSHLMFTWLTRFLCPQVFPTLRALRQEVELLQDRLSLAQAERDESQAENRVLKETLQRISGQLRAANAECGGLRTVLHSLRERLVAVFVEAGCELTDEV